MNNANAPAVVKPDAAKAAIVARLDSVKSRMIATCPDPKVGERAMQVAMGLMANPKLLECTSDSIMLAVLGVMKLGLVPDPNIGHAYIIPFRDKRGRKIATLVVGYKGLIHLALRAGADAVTAELVLSNDVFEYGFKDGKWMFMWEPYYIKNPKDAPGEMIGVIVVLHKGDYQIPKFVPKHTLDQRKGKSRSGDDGPWKTDPNAMYLKTGVREAARLWDLSPDLQRAVNLDQAGEDGRAQGSYVDASEFGIADAEFEEEREDPKMDGTKVMADLSPKPKKESVPEAPEVSDATQAELSSANSAPESETGGPEDKAPESGPAPHSEPAKEAPPAKENKLTNVEKVTALFAKGRTAGIKPSDIHARLADFKNGRELNAISAEDMSMFMTEERARWGNN